MSKSTTNGCTNILERLESQKAGEWVKPPRDRLDGRSIGFPAIYENGHWFEGIKGGNGICAIYVYAEEGTDMNAPEIQGFELPRQHRWSRTVLIRRINKPVQLSVFDLLSC